MRERNEILLLRGSECEREVKIEWVLVVCYFGKMLGKMIESANFYGEKYIGRIEDFCQILR